MEWPRACCDRLGCTDDGDDLDRLAFRHLKEAHHRRIGQASFHQLAHRRADAGLDDERERLGARDMRLRGLRHRLDDAAAEIRLDRVAAAIVAAHRAAEHRFQAALQRHHAQRLMDAAELLDDQRAELGADQLDELLGIGGARCGDGERAGDAAEVADGDILGEERAKHLRQHG